MDNIVKVIYEWHWGQDRLDHELKHDSLAGLSVSDVDSTTLRRKMFSDVGFQLACCAKYRSRLWSDDDMCSSQDSSVDTESFTS